MKTLSRVSNLAMLLLLAALCVLPATQVRAHSPYCTLPTNQIAFSAVPGSSSFALATLGQIPDGLTLTNGTYNGWCVQFLDQLEPGHAYDAFVFPSDSANLPPSLQTVAWDKINYLINHKQGAMEDIQDAIWTLLGDPIDHAISAVAQAMVDDALANGAGFSPAPGQFEAIIVEPVIENIQRLIIEMVCAPPPNNGRIEGFVKRDANCSGLYDANLPGLSNVVVKLTEAGADQMFNTADDLDLGFVTTDEQGFYFFNDISNGLYRVGIETNDNGNSPLIGMMQTFDVDTILDSQTFITNSSAAAVIQNINFAYCQQAPAPKGSISGIVYGDVNGNGIYDAGDVPLGGVTVTLSTGATMPSAADGSYSFTNLDAGHFTVSAPALAGGRKLHTASPLSVSLAEGENKGGNNFGYVLGSIAGIVYTDINRTSMLDAGDTGLGGVTVTLSAGGSPIATTTTAANGSYIFTDLMAGSYSVSTPAVVEGKKLNTLSPIPVSLAEGEMKADVNFGYVLGGIAGIVYSDLNKSASYDGGEPGIGGVVVTLSGPVSATTNTQPDGSHPFAGLPAGNYVVTAPAVASGKGLFTPSPLNVTLAAGERRMDVNFGYVLGSLGGLVWSDLNGNGLQDPGEPGVSGVSVVLMDCASSNVLRSTSTGLGGSYLLSDMAAGSYCVRFAAPSGQMFTLPNAGSESLDSDAMPATGVTECYTLAAGQNNRNVDAGLINIAPPCITNCTPYVACTPPYPFVSSTPRTSIIFNESEVLRGFTVAVASGCMPKQIRVYYSDEHALVLGVRRVIVKTASGTATTDYPVTPQSGNPNGAFNPMVGSVALSGDQAGTDLSERPLYPALFITDVTSNLTSLAGDWQYGGTAIPPHAVFGAWKGAVRTVDKTRNPALVTVTPDADPAKNSWTLPGGDAVPAGLENEGYGAEVRWETEQLGLLPGHTYRLYFMVHDGDQNKQGGDAGHGCATLTMGPQVDCRPSLLGSIGGTAFCDSNGNGVFDSTDAVLSGVTVTLNTGATAVTGTNGSYLFSGLAAGTYTVSAPASMSGKNLATASPITVALAAGENRRDVNFGYLNPMVSISGSVFNDLNGNGVLNASSELGVSGVTVRLFYGTIQIAYCSADANGAYLFKNLQPGAYTVKLNVPSGYAEEKAIAGVGGAVVNNTSIKVTAASAGACTGQNFLICPSAGFTTYAQNGWGAKPNGKNAASLLAKLFPTVYPGGLTVGGTFTIKLNSQLAVQNYLPSGGSPNCLKKNYVNPVSTESGTLGAQVAALRINVDFSSSGITKAGLANLKVVPGKKLSGYTVGQILAIANSVLGGTTSALPAGCNISELSSTLDNINKNFDGGSGNGGYLTP